MSDLITGIKAFQHVIRQALHEELSPEERADIAEVAEALRLALRDQHVSAGDGRRLSTAPEQRVGAATSGRRRNRGKGGCS